MNKQGGIQVQIYKGMAGYTKKPAKCQKIFRKVSKKFLGSIIKNHTTIEKASKSRQIRLKEKHPTRQTAYYLDTCFLPTDGKYYTHDAFCYIREAKFILSKCEMILKREYKR